MSTPIVCERKLEVLAGRGWQGTYHGIVLGELGPVAHKVLDESRLSHDCIACKQT